MKHYNRDGSLSAYALACGYIQSHFIASREVQLYREYNCYHIRVFNREGRFERRVWESLPTLGEARKYYAKWLRTIKKAAK